MTEPNDFSNLLSLPPDDLANLKRLQANIPTLEAAIRKAERAGIVVTELKAQLEEAKAQIQKLLAVYG